MTGNCHVRCGVGENLEIISKSYLSLFFHIIHLKDRSPDKIIMPLFAIEEAIYFGAKRIFEKIYDEHRYAHGDQTLSIYLFRSIYMLIFDHYTRVYNTFGGYTVKVHVEAGDDESNEHAIKSKLFIPNKKVRSNRFSTDAYQPYYMKKSEHSKFGLNDTPTYRDVRATMQENDEQNSLLFKQINAIFLNSDDGNGG